jgi:hypothetical protein
MIRSHDDVIRVSVVESIGDATPVAADFSIINLPIDAEQAKRALSNLYNAPTARHVALLLNRHRRKDRLAVNGHIAKAESFGLSYLDTVSIWYERPSSCSNNGFLPMCEVGQLVYKGATPDVKSTEWFGDDTSNATNLWGVTTQDEEGKQLTYHQKFCWEVPLLLLSLSKPLEYRRFVYAADLTEQELPLLFKFCRHFNIGVDLYVNSDKLATHIVRSYAAEFSE